jgi:RNA polymerase sigma factor (sigma-70 family)
MLVTTSTADVLRDDADLVARSLAGSGDAFAGIVSRYQALVCSIAYSATGSLSQSEDLAQETFLSAWRELRGLREPSRLRSWLCGIARNLVNNSLRRQGREPATQAEPLEAAETTAAQAPLPPEQAISKEEEQILWRSLERIPDAYREPLVLFYREQQSVESVAASLELSEDVVRQRLSRGRRLLHEQVLAFVEGALERSSPGKAFTLGVVAALPFAPASAGALALGATAAKGGALAKAAGFLAVFTALVGPLTSLLSGYAGVKASLNVMRAPREREVLFRQVKVMAVGAALFIGAVFALVLPRRFWFAHPTAVVALGVAVGLGYGLWIVVMLARYTLETRRVRAEQRRLHPELFAERTLGSGAAFEYRSRATLLGLPLVHVRYVPAEVDAAPALGWIAVGDRAVGILFALGAMAFGGVSVGSVSAGVIAVGGVSLGVVSLGAVSVGILVLGSIAAGVVAIGAFSLGWKFSMGAVAAAKDLALGGLAIGEHENDAAARAFAVDHHLGTTFYVLLAAVFVLAVLPTAFLAWRTRRRRGPSPQSG